MAYWTQITTYPSLLLGPMVLAALIAGIISLTTAWQTRTSTSQDVDRKIDAEREMTDRKLNHERDKSFSERAWADYALRRDIYLDLAKQISCLFEGGLSLQAASPTVSAQKQIFMETTRKVRLIGSDDVVRALNDLTQSMKEGKGPAALNANYANLMNAVRHDIRQLNQAPPIGTALDVSAFPIES